MTVVGEGLMGDEAAGRKPLQPAGALRLEAAAESVRPSWGIAAGQFLPCSSNR